jgi:hypothetical protein
LHKRIDIYKKELMILNNGRIQIIQNLVMSLTSSKPELDSDNACHPMKERWNQCLSVIADLDVLPSGVVG